MSPNDIGFWVRLKYRLKLREVRRFIGEWPDFIDVTMYYDDQTYFTGDVQNFGESIVRKASGMASNLARDEFFMNGKLSDS